MKIMVGVFEWVPMTAGAVWALGYFRLLGREGGGFHAPILTSAQKDRR